ncbi:hypothetical protein HDU93_004332 [Gonapodya sp. JEL0774]|nr:hypothetical protein HDU93_004332 [Gonapodya sp. JEL0774]
MHNPLYPSVSIEDVPNVAKSTVSSSSSLPHASFSNINSPSESFQQASPEHAADTTITFSISSKPKFHASLPYSNSHRSHDTKLDVEQVVQNATQIIQNDDGIGLDEVDELDAFEIVSGASLEIDQLDPSSRDHRAYKVKRTHSGEKRFPCDICNMRFARAYDLKRHGRFHTDENGQAATNPSVPAYEVSTSLAAAASINASSQSFLPISPYLFPSPLDENGNPTAFLEDSEAAASAAAVASRYLPSLARAATLAAQGRASAAQAAAAAATYAAAYAHLLPAEVQAAFAQAAHLAQVHAAQQAAAAAAVSRASSSSESAPLDREDTPGHPTTNPWASLYPNYPDYGYDFGDSERSLDDGGEARGSAGADLRNTAEVQNYGGYSKYEDYQPAVGIDGAFEVGDGGDYQQSSLYSEPTHNYDEGAQSSPTLGEDGIEQSEVTYGDPAESYISSNGNVQELHSEFVSDSGATIGDTAEYHSDLPRLDSTFSVSRTLPAAVLTSVSDAIVETNSDVEPDAAFRRKRRKLEQGDTELRL